MVMLPAPAKLRNRSTVHVFLQPLEAWSSEPLSELIKGGYIGDNIGECCRGY